MLHRLRLLLLISLLQESIEGVQFSANVPKDTKMNLTSRQAVRNLDSNCTKGETSSTCRTLYPIKYRTLVLGVRVLRFRGEILKVRHLRKGHTLFY